MDTVQCKISKIGDSYGVTIPSSMLEQLGLAPGDNIQLRLVREEIHLIKETQEAQSSSPEGVSADFFDHLQDAFERYDETIKGLVER